MANFMDYLDWRGDLSFAADPFNEIDNYICSQMSMPDLTGLVPEDEKQVSLADTVERYSELWGERGDKLGVLCSPYALPLLRRAAECPRYVGTRLSRYVNVCDDEKDEQFSAVCVHLPDGSTYISYRGTDDTLTSWKEDFLMCALEEVPSQRDSLALLCAAAGDSDAPLRLGGHSKGGNLAVYAAVKAAPDIQDRIAAVYSNDGPGFLPDFFKGDDFLRIADRVHVIMPQYSIVGTFFSQECTEIIKSNKSGLYAHDGFNWEVLGNRFVPEAGLSPSSKAFDTAFDDALNKMDDEERSSFINDLFEALTDSGALTTLTDMTQLKLGQAFEIKKGFSAHPELKAFAQDLIDKMRKEYFENLTEAIDEKTSLNLSDRMKEAGEKWQELADKIAEVFKKN